MDTLNITKSDLKFLFVMSSIVPIMSFIIGFYVANSDTVTGLTTEPPITHTYTKPDSLSTTVSNQNSENKQAAITDEGNSHLSTAAIEETRPAPITKRYIVQAGLFSDIKNAKRFSDGLVQKEMDSHIIDDNKDGTPIFRVIIGSFESEASAKVFLHDIEQAHSIKLYLTAISSTKTSNFIAAL